MQCYGFDCKQADDFININSDVQTMRSDPQYLWITSANLNTFNSWVEKSFDFVIKSEQDKKFQVALTKRDTLIKFHANNNY